MTQTLGLPGLSAARQMRGMSRTALASVLHLPERQVERWERCEATPPILVAIAVAQAVGASLEHLRRDPQNPHTQA